MDRRMFIFLIYIVFILICDQFGYATYQQSEDVLEMPTLNADHDETIQENPFDSRTYLENYSNTGHEGSTFEVKKYIKIKKVKPIKKHYKKNLLHSLIVKLEKKLGHLKHKHKHDIPLVPHKNPHPIIFYNPNKYHKKVIIETEHHKKREIRGHLQVFKDNLNKTVGDNITESFKSMVKETDETTLLDIISSLKNDYILKSNPEEVFTIEEIFNDLIDSVINIKENDKYERKFNQTVKADAAVALGLLTEGSSISNESKEIQDDEETARGNTNQTEPSLLELLSLTNNKTTSFINV